METIPRLSELRKETQEIDHDLAELGAKKANLEEALSQAQEATDKNLIERYRAGEPVRQGDLEAKTKDLESNLAIVQATFGAMMKHREVLLPELAELEQAQKLAEGWHSVALPFVVARILSAQVSKRAREVFQRAPERRIRLSSGDYRVEKRGIPANLGCAHEFEIRLLESEAVKAAHRVDPGRFPRAETVDLTTVDQGIGFDTRATRMKDRRILTAIWESYLAAEQHFLEEYGLDIGPTAEEIDEKIKQTLPSRPTQR